MAYEMYIGAMLCPVAPSKIEMKIKGQNKNLTLINDIQINVLKNPGLSEISFDILLPNSKYPFAVYEMGFKNAEYFLNQLEKMKVEKKPIWFQLIRFLPTNKITFMTQMKVSLEEYSIKDDVKQGFDITVSVKLKQYHDFTTKTHDISLIGIIEKSSRPSETSPEPVQDAIYTVVKGDCLWNIAKRFYGDGSKYTVIYEANKDKIKSNMVIYAGQQLVIPGVSDLSKYPSTVKSKTKSKKTTVQSVQNTVEQMQNFENLPENLRPSNYSKTKTTPGILKPGYVKDNLPTSWNVSTDARYTIDPTTNKLTYNTNYAGSLLLSKAGVKQ